MRLSYQRLHFLIPAMLQHILRSRLLPPRCPIFRIPSEVLIFGNESPVVCAYGGCDPVEGLNLFADGVALVDAVGLVCLNCDVED